MSDMAEKEFDKAESGSRVEIVPGLEKFPVAQVVDLLPPDECGAFFDAVCTGAAAFHRPNAPGTYRGGPLSYTPASNGVGEKAAGPLHKACLCLSERIQKLLPEIFRKLNVEAFPVADISLTLVNGQNGHLGIPHTDDSGGGVKISLLYYFHSIPKLFRGGDLQFFDNDSGAASGHSVNPVGILEHTDNLLVAFPSGTFHGITEVICDSESFKDGRFVAIGFLGPGT